MGLFSRKAKPEPTAAVTVTGTELHHAARALNAGNQAPADALVERGGTDKAARQTIAMRVLAASIDEQ
ncbi:hypothetical protein [Streptomyces fradiae]|uniref:hypothetical protein n=1 Tax=Streptomyces fradiae TaxID=1906 RepID=UPI0036A09981